MVACWLIVQVIPRAMRSAGSLKWLPGFDSNCVGTPLLRNAATTSSVPVATLRRSRLGVFASLLPSEKYAQSIGQASGVSVAKCAKSGYQSEPEALAMREKARRVECCPGGEKPCKRVARDGAADAGTVGFAAFPLDLGNDFFFQQAKLVLGASRKGGIVGKQAGAFPRRKVVVPAGGFDGDKRERRAADVSALVKDVEAIPVINMQVNDVIEAVAVVADTVVAVDTVAAAADRRCGCLACYGWRRRRRCRPLRRLRQRDCARCPKIAPGQTVTRAP